MARSTRDTRLETRGARDKIKDNKRHWRTVAKGLALGYRRGVNGGTWYARLLTEEKKHTLKGIGNADDHQDANGIDVFDFFQAQERVRAFADDYAQGKITPPTPPYLVADAIRDYLAWYAVNKKALGPTTDTCNAHILPKLGDRPIADLTPTIIRAWLNGLIKEPPRARCKKNGKRNYRTVDIDTPDSVRKRKASANRIFTVLKAALNYAWREGKAPSDDAWRRVQPFQNVNSPKITYLMQDECIRLLNACDPDFRQLVRAALLTGCRYSELLSPK